MADFQLKAGMLLVLETGEYSDSRWHGPFVVKRDFTRAEAAERFRKHWQPTAAQLEWDDDPKPSPEDFMGWLNLAGYIEDVPEAHSWHVGSYGDFEPCV